jgi:hypothetical protein
LHGFRASEFHAKCDNTAKTLTVVKSAESGNIFGGYTEALWNAPLKGCTYKMDKNAFLFSLVNKEKTSMKMNIAIGKVIFAIRTYRKYGPIFGHDQDIFINLDNEHGQGSYARIGDSYIFPKYKYDTNEANEFLAGSKRFTIAEIEVFQIQ